MIVYMIWFQAHNRRVFDCLFLDPTLAEKYVASRARPDIFEIDVVTTMTEADIED